MSWDTHSDAHLCVLTEHMPHVLILQMLISYVFWSNAMVTSAKYYGKKL